MSLAGLLGPNPDCNMLDREESLCAAGDYLMMQHIYDFVGKWSIVGYGSLTGWAIDRWVCSYAGDLRGRTDVMSDLIKTAGVMTAKSPCKCSYMYQKKRFTCDAQVKDGHQGLSMFSALLVGPSMNCQGFNIPSIRCPDQVLIAMSPGRMNKHRDRVRCCAGPNSTFHRSGQ